MAANVKSPAGTLARGSYETDRKSSEAAAILFIFLHWTTDRAHHILSFVKLQGQARNGPVGSQVVKANFDRDPHGYGFAVPAGGLEAPLLDGFDGARVDFPVD